MSTLKILADTVIAEKNCPYVDRANLTFRRIAPTHGYFFKEHSDVFLSDGLLKEIVLLLGNTTFLVCFSSSYRMVPIYCINFRTLRRAQKEN